MAADDLAQALTRKPSCTAERINYGVPCCWPRRIAAHRELFDWNNLPTVTVNVTGNGEPLGWLEGIARVETDRQHDSLCEVIGKAQHFANATSIRFWLPFWLIVSFFLSAFSLIQATNNPKTPGISSIIVDQPFYPSSLQPAIQKYQPQALLHQQSNQRASSHIVAYILEVWSKLLILYKKKLKLLVWGWSLNKQRRSRQQSCQNGRKYCQKRNHG